jgi:hypothetical protein
MEQQSELTTPIDKDPLRKAGSWLKHTVVCGEVSASLLAGTLPAASSVRSFKTSVPWLMGFVSLLYLAEDGPSQAQSRETTPTSHALGPVTAHFAH